MINLIVVYGTLKDGLDDWEWTKHKSTEVLPGSMIDLVSFPAVVSGTEGVLGEFVGHVYEINREHLAKVLTELDRYEGVERGLYKRVTIQTSIGTAWLYVMPTIRAWIPKGVK